MAVDFHDSTNMFNMNAYVTFVRFNSPELGHTSTLLSYAMYLLATFVAVKEMPRFFGGIKCLQTTFPYNLSILHDNLTYMFKEESKRNNLT